MFENDDYVCTAPCKECCPYWSDLQHDTLECPSCVYLMLKEDLDRLSKE